MSGSPRKLTDADVAMLRQWWVQRHSLPTVTEMSRRYGISLATMARVCNYQTYKRVRP